MEAVLETQSLLDLRYMLGLSARELLTMTHLSGKINGCSFTGSGVGCMDRALGRSTGEIELIGFPESFAVPLCKSWHCKHHQNGAEVYRKEATIEYTRGAKGSIFTVGEVRRLGIGASLCFNTFDGSYEGPTEVEKIFPWRVNYKRIRAGVYEMTCVRQLIAEGRVVEANWNGKMTVTAGEDIPDHAIDFSQESFSWEWNPDNSHYTETLQFQINH